jgi:hypothetical protein
LTTKKGCFAMMDKAGSQIDEEILTRNQCATGTCYETVNQILQSPRVRKILSFIDQSPIFSCTHCPENKAAGSRALLIASQPLQVVLCTNQIHESEIEEAVVHELVHAFDYTEKKCDFGTCKGLAYSEVRAAAAAECSGGFKSEFLRKQCIRRTAIMATYNKYPSTAMKCVDAVFESALNDTEPFNNSHEIV